MKLAGINWSGSFDTALYEARRTGRYILLFFHRPDSRGSKKTRVETFTAPEVIELLDTHFVPVEVDVTRSQTLSAGYGVEWTPTFIITDEEGMELERWVGYLPPEDFVRQARLAEGLSELHRKRFREAERDFEWIIDHAPDSSEAPKARYFMGVALYKATGDRAHLERTWEAMRKRYPGSSWTKRASAWS